MQPRGVFPFKTKSKISHENASSVPSMCLQVMAASRGKQCWPQPNGVPAAQVNLKNVVYCFRCALEYVERKAKKQTAKKTQKTNQKIPLIIYIAAHWDKCVTPRASFVALSDKSSSCIFNRILSHPRRLQGSIRAMKFPHWLTKICAQKKQKQKKTIHAHIFICLFQQHVHFYSSCQLSSSATPGHVWPTFDPDVLVCNTSPGTRLNSSELANFTILHPVFFFFFFPLLFWAPVRSEPRFCETKANEVTPKCPHVPGDGWWRLSARSCSLVLCSFRLRAD